jgi:hypothetical protein
LLGRSPRVAITDKSGVDGISIWVNEYFGLSRDDRISKIKVHRVAQWIMDQYEKEGRLSTITDEELETKVKEYMPDFCLKYNGSLKNIK